MYQKYYIGWRKNFFSYLMMTCERASITRFFHEWDGFRFSSYMIFCSLLKRPIESKFICTCRYYILYCDVEEKGGGDRGLKITRKRKKNSKSRRRNCVHYNIFHLSQPHSSFRASRSLTTVSSAMHNMLILFVTDKLHCATIVLFYFKFQFRDLCSL